jgi:predicted enzyme related to lactoylglutathione lyase
MERSTVPGVGDLAFLADPSGNLVGVIQYARD